MSKNFKIDQNIINLYSNNRQLSKKKVIKELEKSKELFVEHIEKQKIILYDMRFTLKNHLEYYDNLIDYIEQNYIQDKD
tara:strand:+ start:285 stop:521 length:237 start_codon:yes stop_codon:yes gene_type:complete